MHKLVEIKGVGEVLAIALAEKGFHSVQDVAEATEAELTTVSGVSTVRAAQLIRSAEALLNDGRPPVAPPQPRVTNGDQPPHHLPEALAAKKALPAAIGRPIAAAGEPLPAQPTGPPNNAAPCGANGPTDDADTSLPPVGKVPAQSKADSSTSTTKSLKAPDKAKKKKKKKKGEKSKNAKRKELGAKAKNKGKDKKSDKTKKDKKKKNKKQKSKEKPKKKKAKKQKKK